MLTVIDYFYRISCLIVRHAVIAAYNVSYVKCYMNMIQILPDNRIDKNYWTIDTRCDLRGLVKGYILQVSDYSSFQIDNDYHLMFTLITYGIRIDLSNRKEKKRKPN